jgi:poly(A) polymerase
MHQRPAHYDGTWTDAAVRRLIRDAGEALEDLLDLSRADVTSHRPGVREAVLARLTELQARAAELIRIEGEGPLLPKKIGQEIMMRFGIETNPRVGEIKEQLEQAILDGLLRETPRWRRTATFWTGWPILDRARPCGSHDVP